MQNKNLTSQTNLNNELPETHLDVVFINNLTGKTIIGICEDELHNPQEIIVDISMGVPYIKACNSDNINHTINYDKVRSNVLKIMKNHNFKLLESFAEAIADIILNDFGAHWTKVKVIKPKKYIDVDSVGIVIERKSTKKYTIKPQSILKIIGAGHVPDD